MLVSFPVSGVQRRGSDGEPAGHRAGVGNPGVAPDLAEMALTVTRPHIVLFLNAKVDRAGSRFQTPSASWLLRSTATVDISSLTLSQSFGKPVDDAGEDGGQRRCSRHDA